MNGKPLSSHSLKSSAGFTLVELLVVIVIIVALAGIGFPLANRMRSKASDSKCAEQLRSWSSVIAAYSADNSGLIECKNWNSIGEQDGSKYVKYFTGSGDESYEAGFRTLSTMRCCPALKGKDAIASNGNSLTAYTMTEPTGASAGKKEVQYSLPSIKNPSRFVVMIEATGGAPTISKTAEYASRVKPLTGEKQRHAKGVVNAIFADFSVQALTLKDIEKNVVAWTTYN